MEAKRQCVEAPEPKMRAAAVLRDELKTATGDARTKVLEEAIAWWRASPTSDEGGVLIADAAHACAKTHGASFAGCVDGLVAVAVQPANSALARVNAFITIENYVRHGGAVDARHHAALAAAARALYRDDASVRDSVALIDVFAWLTPPAAGLDFLAGLIFPRDRPTSTSARRALCMASRRMTEAQLATPAVALMVGSMMHDSGHSTDGVLVAARMPRAVLDGFAIDKSRMEVFCTAAGGPAVMPIYYAEAARRLAASAHCATLRAAMLNPAKPENTFAAALARWAVSEDAALADAATAALADLRPKAA